MSKSTAMLLAGMVIVVVVWRVQSPTRPTAPPVDDHAAVRQVIDKYYDALRAGRWGEAVTYYEADAFKGTKLNPPEALKQATEFSGGIPGKPRLEALRIEGDRAVGELVIDRPGEGPVEAVLTDEEGRRIGTWAKMLNFVKQGGAWKISATDPSSGGVDAKQALKLLEGIKASQK